MKPGSNPPAPPGPKPAPPPQPVKCISCLDPREVFRIAGGDIECCPNPTPEQALDCLRDLAASYNECLRQMPW